MSRPARVEYGYAAGQDSMWCAKRVDVQGRMLCGRRKSWMPPVPPLFQPPNLCPDCRRVLEAGPPYVQDPDDQAEGTCPVCVGQAPLDEHGRIAEHNEWSWQDGRLTTTSRPCDGAGQTPEGES